MTPSPRATIGESLPFDRGVMEALATYWGRLKSFMAIFACGAMALGISILITHESSKRAVRWELGIVAASTISLLLTVLASAYVAWRGIQRVRSGVPTAASVGWATVVFLTTVTVGLAGALGLSVVTVGISDVVFPALTLVAILAEARFFSVSLKAEHKRNGETRDGRSKQ